MKKAQINKFIIATLSSVVSGAIIGLLFAPEKGSAIRKKLTRKGDKYLRKIKDELEQLRRHLNKQAEGAKEGVNEFGESAKAKGKEIFTGAKKLTSYEEWTKEELYERAKTAGIEGYSKMSKDELIEALKNR